MSARIKVEAFVGKVPTTSEIEAFQKLGDVNRDGVIDWCDLTLFIKAFGATPDSPNWNPDCDLNGDGIIDLMDITTATHNYGKTILSVRKGEALVKTPFGNFVTPFIIEFPVGDYVIEGTLTSMHGKSTQIKAFTIRTGDLDKDCDVDFYFAVLPLTISSLVVPTIIVASCAGGYYTVKKIRK